MSKEHTCNALNTPIIVLFVLEGRSAGASCGGDGAGPASGLQYVI